MLHTIDQSFYSSEAQAHRGEETEIDPDQFQDPDNEYRLFVGTTYEADDEEADKIYEKVDRAMDLQKASEVCPCEYSSHFGLFDSFSFTSICREAQEQAELSKLRAE